MQRATRGRAHLLTFAENTSLHSSPGPVEISPSCFLYCPFCSLEDSSNCWSSCSGMLQELRGEDRQVRVRDFHWMPGKVALSAGKCSEQRREAFIATPRTPRGDTRTRTHGVSSEGECFVEPRRRSDKRREQHCSCCCGRSNLTAASSKEADQLQQQQPEREEPQQNVAQITRLNANEQQKFVYYFRSKFKYTVNHYLPQALIILSCTLLENY